MIIGTLPAWIPTVNAGAVVKQVACAPVAPAPFCLFLHPGITDPYKPGYSHTLDTLWGTQGGAAQTRELFDGYLDYAILASTSDSIGDFQFDLVIPPLTQINFIQIYVPPEFQFLGPSIEESIWTDITNDYQYIWQQRLRAYDPIAPGWTRITIGFDEWWGGLMTINPGTYHIRLFDVRAPEVAGLYHFKIRFGTGFTYAPLDIGAGNYPVAIVKQELNPALIRVEVRAHLGIAPPLVSGSVLAEGTTPEGRAVSAIGYWGPNEFLFNSFVAGQIGAVYGVWIFGAAAGTYTLTAQASGYSPSTTDRFTLDPGQSYFTRMVIFDSPDVSVTIWSKHGTGAIPWGNLWQLPYGTNNPTAAPNNAWRRRDVLIELYDPEGTMIGWWASNALWPAAPKYIPPSNRLMGLHDDLTPGLVAGLPASGGTIPTATSYHAMLYDNFDLLGNARGYPSTRFDGHVPWATGDYIAGMPNGQYTVEAFVTGYIMDEADAYQRSFTLTGTAYGLQFDLRRSNWIETVMHLPANVFLSGPTTVSLFAEDAGGNERAAIAFLATTAMSADGRLDGVDASSLGPAPGYTGGIVMEGWNAVFPNVGTYWNRGVRMANDPVRKDYGLNPTASTHTAGTVTLAGNPYTIRLNMADMGQPYLAIAGTGWYNIVGGDPQVSIFLCNSPASLSFGITNAWVWISLRSVDFQVPAHSRPWTFPGSEIWVEFVDAATGAAVDWLDPTLYGLIQDPGMWGPPVAPWPVPFWGGFPIVGAAPGVFGVSPFDIDNVNLPGRHEELGLIYYGSDFTSPTWGFGLPIYRAMLDWRPTRLPPGEYTYTAYTHGYIMRRSFPVQLPATGGADIEADMIQGGQIRVIMNFNHEGIATNFNGFIRVEVFDPAETLVGASIYGMAEPNVFTQLPTGGYIPYDTLYTSTGGAVRFDHKLVVGPAQGADFGLPVANFPSTRAPVFPVPPEVGNGQRAWFSGWLWYGAPSTTWAPSAFWPPWGWLYPAPSDANRVTVPAGGVEGFDIYGFYWYHGGPARTWAGGWPTVNTFPGVSAWTGIQWDSGIKGSVDIPGWPGSGGGLYTVKVWAFDPRGPDNAYEAAGATDDWRMYAMGWPLENIEVPWGGSVELFVTMNNMASLRGTVRWFDMYGNLRPLAWAQVSASPGPDTDTYPAYSSGNGAIGAGVSDPSGAFIMWLPAGAHDVSVSTAQAPQIWSASAPTVNAEYTVVVSSGWVGGGDTQLSGSGTPIPELPSAVLPLGLFAVLAASLWLLRKKTLNVPVLIK